ncbi:predicted protein [Naegleria gruberi]|uniref:Adenylate kinase isoenzyme 6 homolog n=1 Tax=Naegleria gruberi TaxID=5762 RepID=D2V9X4_NAEGR|nr:uncharacterized protein NAEGRDRAFT_44441 [Naegleria gruberi]EFC46325.1 predicted protein [Naegleria gruberi]|eukprot:XP_002679069.1 predicted protein [Naegleria gruberi strain NEG-M]
MQTSPDLRTYPNILITGTPGVGKTVMGEAVINSLKEKLNLTNYEYLNVSEIAKGEQFVEEFDSERDTYVLDEDKLLDHLEEKLSDLEKGFVIDYHSSELFPERWIDFVIVLRCDPDVLFKRLEKRGYSEQKVQENVDCEIFQVCSDEAQESYKPEIVFEKQNITIMDLNNNAEFIVSLVQNKIQK